MFARAITNAPHIPRLRAFLDTRDLVRNPVRVFERYRAELGPTFTFHFGGTETIVSSSPTFIQHVLQTNHDNYHKSEIQIERLAEFEGNGLLNAHGEPWLRQRRFLSQGFRRDRLATLLPMQESLLSDAMTQLDGDIERGTVDVYQLMVGWTLRLVGLSLFGRRMTDEQTAEISNAITTIQAFMVRQIIEPYKIPWFRLSGQTSRYQRLRHAADTIVREYIEARAHAPDSNGAHVIDLMLGTPYKDSGTTMSRDQMLVESMQLMVAGNETSSCSLAWTFYLLGKHPEFIPAIRDEVETVLGDGPITFKALHQMHLTARVLDEAMRLYPSFWMIDRVALQDDVIDGIRIPAGMAVVPYIYGLHRNPDVWPNPAVFDPSRFEDGAAKARHSFAHIPFGGGPRVCIGSNMAMMQMLLIVSQFIRRYDFELADPGDVAINPLIVLHPQGQIRMRVRRVP